MLTIRGPIQLHIGKDMLTTGSESFGQRIRSNYDLLRTSCTPKNLLFLLTAPQDLPEQEGGMTTLVSQQNETNIQSITMDVVNNVINRILLDGTNQFTYQDQVYITSVLNRLGITDVEEFMTQIRQMRTENETVVHLTETYQSQLRDILVRQAKGEPVPMLPLRTTHEEGETPAPQDPRVSMSLQIFQRLGTGKLYEIIHQLQRNWRGGSTMFQHNEFRMAEQLRFSNQLSLAELKQQIYQQPQLRLLHHLNQYETSLLLEAPKTEEQVISQAAVAALVTAVDQTVVEVLNRPEIRNQSWVHLEHAIWQTAEQTLARYETYHSQDLLLPQTADSPLNTAENHYLQELNDYQTLYQSLYPRAQEFGRAVGVPPMSRLLMTHLTHVQEGDEVTEITRQEAPYTPMEPVKPLARPAAPSEESALQPLPLTLKEAEEQAPEVLVEQMNRIDEHNRTILQAVEQAMQKQSAPPIPTGPDMKRTMRDSLRALEDPETVLQEIRAEAVPPSMVHPELTPKEEALLSQADPVTQQVYEKILQYEQNPEQALSQGLLKPANIGALTADLKRAAQTPEAVELEYAEPPARQEPEASPETTELLLERFLQKPIVHRTVETVLQTPSAIRLIHKQAAPTVSEELLEELQTNRTRTNVQTETREQVNRQQTQQVDLHQTEHKIVTQTTEDLTQLVNRTLSQQMRTISDQVYRQMERRLQTERSRRGRF